MNLFNDIQITDFEWLAKPATEPRTPNCDMPEEILKSIKKYPYEITNDAIFRFRFTYKGNSYQRSGKIEAGFYYNMANIPWIVEPVSFDKHSPFVADASLVHDWVLFKKDKKDDYKGIYFEWNLSGLKMSHREFRILTSKLFERVLQYAGVKPVKRRFMTQPMDLAQKFFRWPSWMKAAGE